MARWLLKDLQALMIHLFGILFPSPGEHISISEETIIHHSDYLQDSICLGQIDLIPYPSKTSITDLLPDIRDLELLDTIPALHHGRGVGNPRWPWNAVGWRWQRAVGGWALVQEVSSEQNIMNIVVSFWEVMKIDGSVEWRNHRCRKRFGKSFIELP